MSQVLPPDMEKWLTAYVYGHLAVGGHDVDVDNKEPSDLSLPLNRPLVVVRDDSGPKLSAVTFGRQIGVSVLAGTRDNDQSSNDLARLVFSALTDDAVIEAEGSPIASIEWDDCNGPYAVSDPMDVARRYMTVGYTAVGSF